MNIVLADRDSIHLVTPFGEVTVRTTPEGVNVSASASVPVTRSTINRVTITREGAARMQANIKAILEKEASL